MKYDITKNEGKPISVTAFIGGVPFIATMEHPNFERILTMLANDVRNDSFEGRLRDLFDMTAGIKDRFEHLSERVTIKAGRIYFDGDEINDALSQTIVRFYGEGNDDFKPLVAFMEKIATNPNKHSRENLFRWLGKHKFAIAPDGDFWAYKGVHADMRSSSSGTAIVNGVEVRGQIPNVPGSIIEMPRSDVQHDPRQGCSTGLHVANWSFARSFLGNQGPVLRIKVNPRDVVSVPTEASSDKMRVCRYRVDAVVTAEDQDVLYASGERRITKVNLGKHDDLEVKSSEPVTAGHPAKKRGGGKKKAAAKKAAPKPEQLPTYYEDFEKRHFEACQYDELRWLCSEWELAHPRPANKAAYVRVLTAAAKRFRRSA